MPVFKRGETYYCRFQINGTIFKRSTGARTKKEAEAFERSYRAEIERSGAPGAKTYGDALIRWAQGEMPASARKPANHTRPLANIPLDKVVAPAHELRDQWLSDGLSPCTINRRLAAIRRVLNLAYRNWDWLHEPLYQKIQLLSEKGTERHVYLTREEVASIASHMRGQERTITLLAAYTGLRRGELLGLTPSQWRPPYITLNAKTKGGRPRTTVVIDDLHPLIELPWTATDATLRKAWECARTAAGMPHVRFHDLRHTFASWLAADPDIPLTVIRDILGHANLAVTSRYSHLRTSSLDSVARLLTRK